MTIQLEHGKHYKTRCGLIVGPAIQKDTWFDLGWVDDYFSIYQPDGKADFFLTDENNRCEEYDIVEQVEP